MPESNLSDAYYTRFHIWQGMMRSTELVSFSVEEFAQLAKTGWDFIWNEGKDVFEEKADGEAQTKLAIDVDTDDVLKGQYL